MNKKTWWMGVCTVVAMPAGVWAEPQMEVIDAAPAVNEANHGSAASENAMPAVPRWLGEHRLELGGDSGVAFVGGPLARELHAGPQFLGVAGLDTGVVPYTRVELSFGFSRHGRKVDDRAVSLLRVPLSAWAVGFLPLEEMGVREAQRYPRPYLRAGTGVAIAWVGQEGTSRRAERSLDPLFAWGLGARYTLGALWGDPGLAAHIELTHSMQFERRTGHFWGLQLGVGYAPWGAAASAPVGAR